tara:strand:+ start:278 stop:550 length:273 start_codon:yes stop_codon:yes gene_type:complete
MIETISIIGIFLFVAIFVASIWANVFLLRKLLYFNENFQQMQNSIDDFNKHLEIIYEMPTFYGDESLQQLITHSRELKQDLVDFQNRYSE